MQFWIYLVVLRLVIQSQKVLIMDNSISIYWLLLCCSDHSYITSQTMHSGLLAVCMVQILFLRESNMKNLNTIKGITKGAIYLITGLLYLIS